MRPPAKTDATATPTGVVVLGMHRSGTSAATGLLNLLGLATCPKVDMVEGRDNPTGHWESQTLLRMDDILLGQMGRAWWYPPPSGPAYFELADRIATSPRAAGGVLQRVHRTRPWVWKDPRACLLVPFWRAALDSSFVVVWVVRNPLEVAASLARRNDVPADFGIALWERYNRLVCEHLEGIPTLVSRYEDLVSDPDGWCADTVRFLSDCGLNLGSGGPDPRRFVDAELRHSYRTREDVVREAPGVIPLYEVLEEKAVGAWTRFSSPELAEEAPSIETDLRGISPEQMIRLARLPGTPALSRPAGAPRPTAAERRLRSIRRRFFILSRRIPGRLVP